MPVALNVATPSAVITTPESGQTPWKEPSFLIVAEYVAKLCTSAPANVPDKPEATVSKVGFPLTAGRAFIDVGPEIEPSFSPSMNYPP